MMLLTFQIDPSDASNLRNLSSHVNHFHFSIIRQPKVISTSVPQSRDAHKSFWIYHTEPSIIPTSFTTSQYPIAVPTTTHSQVTVPTSAQYSITVPTTNLIHDYRYDRNYVYNATNVPPVHFTPKRDSGHDPRIRRCTHSVPMGAQFRSQQLL